MKLLSGYIVKDQLQLSKESLIFLLSLSLFLFGGDEGSIQLEYISQIKEPAWAWGSEAKIFFDKDKLYIPLGYPGLAVYDISNPELPQRILLMHSNELNGQAGAVAASGERVFVANPDKGSILMLDISEPSNPSVLARFGQIQDILQLYLRGQYLFVYAGSSTAYRGGIYVYDISKEPPVEAGQHLTNFIDPGFYVTAEQLAFIARTPETSLDSAKIDCVDMSVPSHPISLSQWSSPYPGNIIDIHLKNNRLYCAAYWGGLWVLDSTDYSNLSLDARFDWEQTEPYALSVMALPPFIYLAQGGPGKVFRKFNVFRQDGNIITLEKEIPAETFTNSVYLAEDLLILIEIESPWMTSNPQKILHLYKIPRPKPPENVSLRREINRSLFHKEAFHTISWNPNPENNIFVITEYRIYRKYSEESDDRFQLIGSVPSDTFEYLDGYLDYTQKFVYAVTSVDSGDYESEYSSAVEN